MHTHHANYMVDILIDHGIIAKDRKADAIQWMLEYWVDKAAVVWSAGDIEPIVSDIVDASDTLTEEDIDAIVGDVLNEIVDSDCSIGVNWDWIRDTAWSIARGYEETDRRDDPETMDADTGA